MAPVRVTSIITAKKSNAPFKAIEWRIVGYEGITVCTPAAFYLGQGFKNPLRIPVNSYELPVSAGGREVAGTSRKYLPLNLSIKFQPILICCPRCSTPCRPPRWFVLLLHDRTPPLSHNACVVSCAIEHSSVSPTIGRNSLHEVLVGTQNRGRGAAANN